MYLIAFGSRFNEMIGIGGTLQHVHGLLWTMKSGLGLMISIIAYRPPTEHLILILFYHFKYIYI